MKSRRMLMIHNVNSGRRLARRRMQRADVPMRGVSARRMRKTTGQTTRESFGAHRGGQGEGPCRADGEASYLALVKFDHETDLSFKVGGILVSIGPAPGTDWDEGTPVKAGTVLAELKQADFTNALNSARARRRNWRAKLSNVFASCARPTLFPSRNSMLPKRTGKRPRPNWTRRSRIFGIRGWWRPKHGVVLARYVNSGVTVASRPARVALCRYQPDVGRVGIAGPVDWPAHARQGGGRGGVGAGGPAAVPRPRFGSGSGGERRRSVVSRRDQSAQSGRPAALRHDGAHSRRRHCRRQNRARSVFRSRRW